MIINLPTKRSKWQHGGIDKERNYVTVTVWEACSQLHSGRIKIKVQNGVDWTEPEFVDSSVNTVREMHVCKTCRAPVALVWLSQSSRGADARDQWVRAVTRVNRATCAVQFSVVRTLWSGFRMRKHQYSQLPYFNSYIVSFSTIHSRSIVKQFVAVLREKGRIAATYGIRLDSRAGYST